MEEHAGIKTERARLASPICSALFPAERTVGGVHESMSAREKMVENAADAPVAATPFRDKWKLRRTQQFASDELPRFCVGTSTEEESQPKCTTTRTFVAKPARPSANKHGSCFYNTEWHVRVRAKLRSHDEPWTGRGQIDRKTQPTVVSWRSLECLPGGAHRSVSAMGVTRLLPFACHKKTQTLNAWFPLVILRICSLEVIHHHHTLGTPHHNTHTSHLTHDHHTTTHFPRAPHNAPQTQHITIFHPRHFTPTLTHMKQTSVGNCRA